MQFRSLLAAALMTMGQNPLNLAVRFVLEILILVSLGMWGWTMASGVLRYMFAIGMPLVAGVLWGTFRVPHDPGPAPVRVRGWVRLLLELALFCLAAWGLYNSGFILASLIFSGVSFIHYLVSYDRIRWLLKQ